MVRRIFETAAGELGWDHLAPAAKMSLVAVPNGLGDPAIAAVRAQIIAAADRFVGIIAKLDGTGDGDYTVRNRDNGENAGAVAGHHERSSGGKQFQHRQGR